MMFSPLRYAQWSPLAVVLVMVAWALWLVSMARTPLDYMYAQAGELPPLPVCEWVQIGSPSMAEFGFSVEASHAWTYRGHNTIVFRTNPGAAVSIAELRVEAVLGSGVTVVADSGAPVAVEDPGIVRLLLRVAPSGGVHHLVINVAHSRAPKGKDMRWLGVAVSALRVCATR